MEIQEINLRSGKFLSDSQPPPREVEEDKEESEPKAIPCFLERLFVTVQTTTEETELLGELKHLCVKIPLLQAIKDVPIYNRLIKDKFFRHPGRRKRDAPTINVIGQLSDLTLGQVIGPKYLDLGSPLVDVHINGSMIPHTLIDLGAAINVMKKYTMLKLNLQGSLRKTTTMLQLADRSTVTPEGIVEDVMVSIDSWEYLADFLVLQLKENLTRYPRELVKDQGSQFTSNLIEDLLTHQRIKHRTSTPYHPQTNGRVEVTNRALKGILTKVVRSSRKCWVDRLVEATWAYNTTWKTTTVFTPYELVYGKKDLLSIEFELNTLRMAAQLDLDLSHAQKERYGMKKYQ
eukprot:PITA_31891